MAFHRVEPDSHLFRPYSFVAEKWTFSGNLIQISPNEDNQMQAKKVQENIEFEDVLKVIHTLSR